MYAPPFHRRILPWIFAIVFIASAPVLVFYTAGYRYNPLKEKIERNGTMIFDSKPSGAAILLNGTATGKTTPVTVQDVVPGRYVIRYEKDGYWPWEKQLDVLPELVTFANDVRLWKKSSATYRNVPDARSFETSPNDRLVAVLESRGASSSQISVWTTDLALQRSFSFPRFVGNDVILTWSDDARALLAETRSASGTASWLLNVRTGLGPIALPDGTYRWNGTSLEGTSDSSLVTISADDGSIRREPLASGIADRFDDLVLRTATGTDNLVLFRGVDPLHGFILPPGRWRIHGLRENELILRDGLDWLAVDLDSNPPNMTRAMGDALRPYVEKRKTSYLLVNGGEIWRWDAGNNAELLLRESQTVADAHWHSAGRDVVFASGKDVAMLNLDTRDGRIRTVLASFDEITDVAFIKKDLLIAGTKNGQSGLWQLTIE